MCLSRGPRWKGVEGGEDDSICGDVSKTPGLPATSNSVTALGTRPVIARPISHCTKTPALAFPSLMCVFSSWRFGFESLFPPLLTVKRQPSRLQFSAKAPSPRLSASGWRGTMGHISIPSCPRVPSRLGLPDSCHPHRLSQPHYYSLSWPFAWKHWFTSILLVC